MKPQDYSDPFNYEVTDNSYAPKFFAGDVLYVNPRETKPRRGGFFLLIDGNELVFRRLEFVDANGPKRVRISCPGVDKVKPREALVDELRIQGRVWGSCDGDRWHSCGPDSLPRDRRGEGGAIVPQASDFEEIVKHG